MESDNAFHEKIGNKAIAQQDNLALEDLTGRPKNCMVLVEPEPLGKASFLPATTTQNCYFPLSGRDLDHVASIAAAF